MSTTSGAFVTATVSVTGVLSTSVIVKVNVYVVGVLVTGITNVGLAVVGLLNVIPAGAAQENVFANFEFVPSRLTVEVGATPVWSGPALATGVAVAPLTVIV